MSDVSMQANVPLNPEAIQLRQRREKTKMVISKQVVFTYWRCMVSKYIIPNDTTLDDDLERGLKSFTKETFQTFAQDLMTQNVNDPKKYCQLMIPIQVLTQNAWDVQVPTITMTGAEFDDM